MEQLLDTLAVSRRLRSSGMPEKQSEVVVEVVSEAVSGMVTRKHFDERFESLERGLEMRFEKIDDRFESMERKFDARFKKTDARIDKLDANMDKKIASLTVRFTFLLVGLFSLTIGSLAYFTQPLRAEVVGPESTEINSDTREAVVEPPVRPPSR